MSSIELVFRGGSIELEQRDSPDPPLGGHRLYSDRDRQLRRAGHRTGAASRLDPLFPAAPARVAALRRLVFVRSAVRGQVAQQATDLLSEGWAGRGARRRADRL